MNWEQLKTILWLRWRLTRNQWSRSGGLGAVLTAIVAVAAIGLGGASFVGALLGGALGLGAVKPLVLLGIWFGLTVLFLFLWMLGLLAELQRSETIDLQRLMHLPVALGQMFLVNYAASHLALSIFLMVPAMIGLGIGLAISRGLLMLLLLPLAGSMVFMITAWTYCLRGWLAAMMTNPRRRRAIIMGITLGFILMAQVPNLYFNVLRRQNQPRPKPTTTEEAKQQRDARNAAETEQLNQLLALQKFIPPLWLPLGAQTLAEHRVLPALLGMLGCAGLGALGLRRAYRSTVRFYQGETGGKTAASVVAPTPTASAKSPRAGSRLLELRLPAVPEQTSAVALATFRSMLRAPEVKMAWAMSFIGTLVVGAIFLFRAKAPQIPEVAKPFLATGAVTFSIFMLVQFLVNQFGFDRDGFRALILSPAPRRHILLGKNLACLPVGFGFGLTLLVMIAVWAHLSPLTFLAGLFQLITLMLLAGMAGNLLSILVPYRIQAGSMKPTKMPALAMLVMMLCQMLFPLAMAPVFLPPALAWLWQWAGWPRAVPVNLLGSILIAGLATLAYWRTLEPLGRLLYRRETKILNTISAEVE